MQDKYERTREEIEYLFTTRLEQVTPKEKEDCFQHKVAIRLSKKLWTKEEIKPLIEKEFNTTITTVIALAPNKFSIWNNTIIKRTKNINKIKVDICPQMDCFQLVFTSVKTDLSDESIKYCCSAISDSIMGVIRNEKKDMISVFFKEVPPNALLMRAIFRKVNKFFSVESKLYWYQHYNDSKKNNLYLNDLGEEEKPIQKETVKDEDLFNVLGVRNTISPIRRELSQPNKVRKIDENSQPQDGRKQGKNNRKPRKGRGANKPVGNKNEPVVPAFEIGFGDLKSYEAEKAEKQKIFEEEKQKRIEEEKQRIEEEKRIAEQKKKVQDDQSKKEAPEEPEEEAEKDKEDDVKENCHAFSNADPSIFPTSTIPTTTVDYSVLNKVAPGTEVNDPEGSYIDSVQNIESKNLKKDETYQENKENDDIQMDTSDSDGGGDQEKEDHHQNQQ